MRLVSALLFAAAAAAQPGPHFEVASLKPTQADPQAIGIVRPAPGNQGYIGSNMTLRSYLMIAYVVRDTQIVGAPAWFGNDRYDLNAKAERQSSIEELHVMLQNLLIERCALKIHKETTEVSGFALVVDKGAPKLTAHDPADKNYPPISPGGGPGKVKGINAAMDLFALFLSRTLDVPVADRTGLSAHYDFDFEVVPERVMGADGQERIVRPDAGMITRALREQLGLRLEPAKVASEKIIIDHVEKPTAN